MVFYCSHLGLGLEKLDVRVMESIMPFLNLMLTVRLGVEGTTAILEKREI
jgi:hypothetical protein